MTVTVVLPLTPPLVAVTVPLATELLEAVKSPELLDRARGRRPGKRGLDGQGRAELIEARRRELLRLGRVEAHGDGGLTVMLVSVWFTVTGTLAVAVCPPGSVIVTLKV